MNTNIIDKSEITEWAINDYSLYHGGYEAGEYQLDQGTTVDEAVQAVAEWLCEELIDIGACPEATAASCEEAAQAILDDVVYDLTNK